MELLERDTLVITSFMVTTLLLNLKTIVGISIEVQVREPIINKSFKVVG